MGCFEIGRDQAGFCGLNWDAGPVRTKRDEAGRRQLRDLGSFGSRNISLVGFSEQNEMLIAHRVIPCAMLFGVHKRPRATHRPAFPCLAGFRRTRRGLIAVERYRVSHGTNIARSSEQILIVLSQGEHDQRITRSRLCRTRVDYRPVFARRYARRIEGQFGTGFEKYAVSLDVKVDRAVRPHRSFQSASFAMVPRWWFTEFGVLDEMMALEIWYHGRASLRRSRNHFHILASAYLSKRMHWLQSTIAGSFPSNSRSSFSWCGSPAFQQRSHFRRFMGLFNQPKRLNTCTPAGGSNSPISVAMPQSTASLPER